MTGEFESWPNLLEDLEVDRLAGGHTGVQVYVEQGGQILLNAARGEKRPGVPLGVDDLTSWLSASKPIAAVAILQQIERGRLGLDQPVAKYLPEFGVKGKQVITIRHLLTHTCGFRAVEINWPNTTWPKAIQQICNAPIEPRWVVGETAGYHPATSWYILGELISRVSGMEFSEYVRQQIFQPLGARDAWIGMPREAFYSYGARIAGLWNVVDKPPTPHRFYSEAGCTWCSPGENARGPASALGRFYRMLLQEGEWEGTRLLLPGAVHEMVRPQRVGVQDLTFRCVIDWGLGLILDSKKYGRNVVPYGYGEHASPQTFGHSGNQSSVGFADPTHDLVVVLVFNGMPGEGRHQQRIHAILTGLYEDLGLGA